MLRCNRNVPVKVRDMVNIQVQITVNNQLSQAFKIKVENFISLIYSLIQIVFVVHVAIQLFLINI